jgi:hypothetical protein
MKDRHSEPKVFSDTYSITQLPLLCGSNAINIALVSLQAHCLQFKPIDYILKFLFNELLGEVLAPWIVLSCQFKVLPMSLVHISLGSFLCM